MPIEPHEKEVIQPPPCDCHQADECPDEDKRPRPRMPRGLTVHSAEGVEMIDESWEEETERRRRR